MTTTHRPPPTVITVANVKGGTGKTTTAAFVAHALHERGHTVYAIDADPQGGLLRWDEVAGFPFTVAGKPSGQLQRDVPGLAGDRYDVVVIDTPPTEKGPSIVLSAMRACTHLLVPVAPTPAEYDRLPDLLTVLEQATDLRPDGRPPVHGVQLNRTVTNASSTDVYRGLIAADGWHVLRSIVPRREAYSQALGAPVLGALNTGYGDGALELLALTPTPLDPAGSTT